MDPEPMISMEAPRVKDLREYWRASEIPIEARSPFNARLTFFLAAVGDIGPSWSCAQNGTPEVTDGAKAGMYGVLSGRIATAGVQRNRANAA